MNNNFSKKELDAKRAGALKTSINEGAASSFSSGITNSYITPFALKLTSRSLDIGILSAVSGLAAPVAQILGSKFMENHRRKSVVIYSVLIQALLWIPIALLAWFSYKGMFSQYLIYGLIVIYSLLVSFGGISYPPWFSWMGDLVDEKAKGKYFARRNLVSGIVELAAAVVAVYIVGAFENGIYGVLGFGILFLLAFVFRMFSFELLRTQYIPHLRPQKSYRIRAREFMKNNSNFRNLALYQMFFNVAIMVASPFFAVYMLRDLGFSYEMFIAVTLSSTIFYLIFTPLVGRISDRYGNRRLLVVANIAFVFSPLLWIFIRSPIVLILVPQMVAGLANAALNIGLTNYSYDYLDGKDRGFGVAYLNLLVGLGIFFGSIVGGLLLDYYSVGFMNKFLFVFALAAVLRALVAIVFLPRLSEQKRVARIPYAAKAEHSMKSFHSGAKDFVYYLRERETQGLKVWMGS